ncbi:MAG TPA: hypothetical protein VHY37_11965 [Tepidisphaeraceae bacterium]|nr:hypothetical protein [Tepidisphaeraceae bacterium]
MIRAIGCVVVGLAFFLTGCSTYIDHFEYSPKPAIAEIPAPGAPQPTPPPMTEPGQAQAQPQQPPPPPAVAVLATVIGVHRADSKLGIPDSVEVRLRIDDNGPYSIVFNPQTLDLSNGQLMPFGHPIAPQPVGLEARQTAYVTSYFPFPEGHNVDNTDMSSLVLHWQLQANGRTEVQSVSFTRVWPSYYYGGPYYYSPVYAYPAYPVVGIGIGFHGHWR